MKTKSFFDKYRRIIAGLIGTNIECISFFVKENEKDGFKEVAEELDPEKKDYLRDWSLGEYEVRGYHHVRGVRVETDTWRIASFKLYQLPHCCGVIVSCNAEVHPDFRKRRIGTVLNDLRQDIGRALGYSLILCTYKANNTPQTKLLETNGWSVIQSFKNKRTGNLLNITTKLI